MKITRIEAIPYTIPYHYPMITAAGRLDSAEHVLVRIHTDDGPVGISEAVVRAFVYGESQVSIVEAIRLWFEPALVGLDPFAVEEAAARIAWIPANNTVHGAIDIALHDIRAKVVGVPAWRMLGGDGKPMRVTRILTMSRPEQAAEEAGKAADEEGITSFKIKVAGRDPRLDIACIAALRKAVGDDATIYPDANHGWNAEEAIRALNAMAEYGIDLVEEPSPAEDVIGRKRLAQQVSTVIMGDESVPTLKDAARELMYGSTRALSIKTSRTGFTVSAELVALAKALGARALLGIQADGMIGTSAAIAFGSAHPWVAREPGELDYFKIITDELVVHRLEVKDGWLYPPSRPGIGVEIDEDKLRHYRIDNK